MLLRTHFTIAISGVLFFLPFVQDKFLFLTVTLIATLIPDIDSRFSFIGRKKISRILQAFTKHRGLIHSFTFLIGISIIISLLFPKVAFAFFLGYGLHLISDSFTVNGIKPFYPSKIKASGVIRTGGKGESLVLASFVILSLFLLLINFSRIF